MSRLATCPECSQRLKVPVNGGSFACPNCGRKLKFRPQVSTSDPLPEVDPLDAPPAQPSRRPKRKRPQRGTSVPAAASVAQSAPSGSNKKRVVVIAGIVAGALMLCTAVGLGVYFAFRPTGPSDTKVAESDEPPAQNAEDKDGDKAELTAPDKPKPAANPVARIKADKANGGDAEEVPKPVEQQVVIKAESIPQPKQPQFDRAKNPNTLQRSCEATALVVTAEGTGSAFCIHEQGVFVTNAHVVEGMEEGDEVTLVLRSGTDKELTTKARVARIGTKEDLAVLTVTGNHGLLTALPIGDTSKLQQTDEILALGFPFGEALAVDKDANPSISVNVGRITSLRRADGQLKVIQVDAQVNPGNSGGPVTNSAGEVVGVVVAGIKNSGVHFVIPVDRVTELLEKPIVTFRTPDMFRADQLERPHRIEVAITKGPWADKQDYLLTLIVKSDRERSVAMKKVDGRYVADTPIFKQTKVRGIPVRCEFEEGDVEGVVPADTVITVKNQKVKLTEVTMLRKQASSIYIVRTTTRARSIVGKLAPGDLKDVTVRMANGEQVNMDLSRAKLVEFPKPEAPDSIELIVEIRDKEGGEVARLTKTVGVGQAVVADNAGNNAVPARGGAVGIAALPPAPKVAIQGIKKVKLPGNIGDVCFGGGGRYMICTLPNTKQAAVLDLPAARVARYISLTSSTATVGAGMRDIVAITPENNIATRYDLQTGARKLRKQLDSDHPIGVIGLGHASMGPALIGGGDFYKSAASLLDIKSLKTVRIPANRTGRRLELSTKGGLRTSADGRTWGFHRWGVSPSGVFIYRLMDNGIQVEYDHESAGFILPSPDGSYIYTCSGAYPARINGHDLPPPITRGITLPAVNGNMYLRITGIDAGRGKKPRVTLHMQGSADPIATLPEAEQLMAKNNDRSHIWARVKLTLEKRIVLSPAFGVLALTGSDSVDVMPFNLRAVLAKGGTDFLVVVSQPVTAATPGKLYRYKMAVLSKNGGVKLKLDAGPDGMKIDANGVLQWTPKNAQRGQTQIVITVSDASGQEILHTFPLTCQ